MPSHCGCRLSLVIESQFGIDTTAKVRYCHHSDEFNLTVFWTSMANINDTTCPSCMRPFDTLQAVHSHLRQAKSCKNYRMGKLREKSDLTCGTSLDDTLPHATNPSRHSHWHHSICRPRPKRRRTNPQNSHGPTPPTQSIESQESPFHMPPDNHRLDDLPQDETPCMDNDYFVEDADEQERQDDLEGEDNNVSELEIDEILKDLPDPIGNLFHFIYNVEPPITQPEIGEEGPGPETQAKRSAQYQCRVLEEEEDTRVVEEDMRDGRLIRMSDSMHDIWKAEFGTKDSGEDVNMKDPDKDPNSDSQYAPFASELDWRIADWMVRESPGHNAFDRLLAIPGVSVTLLLYYWTSFFDERFTQ